ncbi:glycosyltransferase [Novipirellula herctigrandis]|uniref:glycosyltransferase n=1 Tax=Novipirellula herctigrandis TaxID=2527986 RepID=UPI003AF3D175
MFRRLDAMAELANVRAFNPQPWFPFIRPHKAQSPLPASKFKIDSAGMFYIPGVAKRFDSLWMQRCVDRWLDSLPASLVSGSILDAHFGYPEGVGCCNVAKRRGIPVFVTLRGLEVDLFQDSTRGPQLIKALRTTTGVIAVSHSLKHLAVKSGVPAEIITVIPNGVDSETFCPGEQSLARQLVGYRSQKKLVVSVGNLKRVKGHDLLIRAIASIRCRVDLNLVCIGSGVTSSWGVKLRRLAQELGVAEQIIFLGSKSPADVANWLRSADLFALASRREGCCNAVLEALSTGLPVVVTNAGDNGLIVKDPDCGRVVAIEDAIALGEAISDSLNSIFDRSNISVTMLGRTWSDVGKRVVDTIVAKTGVADYRIDP